MKLQQATKSAADRACKTNGACSSPPWKTPVWFAAAMLFLPAAIGAGSDRLGGYDFSYESTGDHRVRPVQVFDDGRSTFFQFRAGEPIPAIFADTPTGATLLMPSLEGPYVKVPSVGGAYALRLGYGSSRVSYLGAGRGLANGARETSTSVAGAGPATQVRLATTERLLAASQMISGLPREMFQAPSRPGAIEENSYATPIKGDSVAWTGPADRSQEYPITFSKDSSKLTPTTTKLIRSIAASAKPATRFEIVGKDDDGHKERVAEARAEVVASALISAGASKTAVTTRSTSEVKEAGKGLWFGATLRVFETASTLSPAPRTADAEIASIVTRLQAGRLTPAEAVALIDQSRRAPSPMPTVAVAAAAAPITQWAVRKNDETVQRMLERWAKESGWRLVWQGGPSVAITGDASLTRPDFLQAADYVISQAKTAGYQMRATAYSNQTLVISGEKE